MDFAEDARDFDDDENREDDRHEMAIIRPMLVVVDKLVERQEKVQYDNEYSTC